MISFFGQSNGTAPGEVDLFLLPLVDFIIKTHLAIFITGFGVYIELLMTIHGLLAEHSIFSYNLKTVYSTHLGWSCF